MSTKVIHVLHIAYGAIAAFFGFTFPLFGLILQAASVDVPDAHFLACARALVHVWLATLPILGLIGCLHLYAGIGYLRRQSPVRAGPIAAALTIVWYVAYSIACHIYVMPHFGAPIPLFFELFSFIGTGAIICLFPIYVLIRTFRRSTSPTDDGKHS